jgi:hypothetical protein
MQRYIPVLAILFVLSAPAAHAQLTAAVNIPAISFDPAHQRYAPAPLTVALALYNGGSDTVEILSARIEFLADLGLDASELGTRIKVPAAPKIRPGDSLIIPWKLVHAVILQPRVYRVTMWYRTSASDSASVATNITIPAAGGPVLWLNPYGFTDLAVNPARDGYNNNPFFLRCQIRNNGETPADSVKLRLELPPHFELLQPTAPNPQPVVTPLMPIPIGDPRLEYGWTVRYTGAPTALHEDSIIIIAEGRDRAGGIVTERSVITLFIAAFPMRVEMRLSHPDSLVYDADSVYAPQPVPVRIVVRNPTAQTADTYAHLTLETFENGVGVATPDAVRMMDPIGGYDSAVVVWHRHVDRAAAPRTLRWEATLRDTRAAQVASVVGSTRVPGEPFSLDVVDFALPDSLAVTPDGGAFVSDSLTVEFGIRNSSWMRQNIVRTVVERFATGVQPALPVVDTTAWSLDPGATSQTLRQVYRIAPAPDARSVRMRVTALSHRGDTATAESVVRVPGIRSQFAIERVGIDTLGIDAASRYTPNPFEQRFTVRNTSPFAVRLDSLVLAGAVDGVTTQDPRTLVLFQTLGAGDSLSVSWWFHAEQRDRDRTLPLVCSAWSAGVAVARHATDVHIPLMDARIHLTVEGGDTLRFDGRYVYLPETVFARLEVRSVGTLPLQLDSVVCRTADPFLRPLTPVHVPVGEQIAPGGGRVYEWRFAPEVHPAPVRTALVITAYHDSVLAATDTVWYVIPGRPTAFSVTGISAPLSLRENDSSTNYLGNPFVTSFRAWNDSWVWTTFTSSTVTIEGAAVTQLSSSERSHARLLTGDERSDAIVDTFLVGPSSLDRTLAVTFTVRSADGRIGTERTTIAVPKLRVTALDAPMLPPGVALDLWPNPLDAAAPLHIHLRLPVAGAASVAVHDLAGRLVEQLHQGALAAGEHTIVWRRAGLTPGPYLLVARLGTHTRTRLLVVR